jgi:hypothetical protein
VIGIMPRSFGFMNRSAALILPLQLDRNKTVIGNFSGLQPTAGRRPEVRRSTLKRAPQLGETITVAAR